ncbi:MAG TPA: phosphate ABC transporter substrate-binding protein PstS [Candidatus Dormibacteraeota bacterium]|nr:phosphate ABC transporter substrate-binding protein PstS [Candidatus Dormibacteraeota bacterium]
MKQKFVALVLGCAMVASVATAATAETVKMLETGSSLLYPLMNLWVADYTKDNPGVQITTQSTGSGTGISEAISGVAQIGASDAYMSDSQLKAAPSPMLNIPTAISAQQVNYNLPGLNDVHLKLSGPVLAGIYSGSIRYWDDKSIVALNKAYASKLPHKGIIPIHRSDGSGDTFIFTQYLTFSTPSWKNGPAYGTSISWPAVPTAVGANGNPGMVQACKAAPYSIAYIGVSFLNETDKAGLGYAMLENRAGNFVLPTAENVSAAAAALVSKTPADERISLIFAPGAKSYPIINYEYAIVREQQPNAETAAALKKFLSWGISSDGGNAMKYLDKVHFKPLPESVVKLSIKQIDKIH